MALFEKKKTTISEEPPQDPYWMRSSSAYFHRLIKINKKTLKGQSGVYVIWHAGTEPKWVYSGHTNDLAAAFENAIADKKIMNYENQGGLYASWSLIRKEYQPGVVRYMIEKLNPLIKNHLAPISSVTPIAVFPPGARGPAI